MPRFCPGVVVLVSITVLGLEFLASGSMRPLPLVEREMKP
jgi:hypothetical protein